MGTKLEEAKEHVKAGEKALKTSLLKWKPDFDTAADEFSQAAQCFRIAKDMRRAAENHIKASEYYEMNGAFFHAAKSLESSIIVCKDFAKPDQLLGMAQQSCSLYQQHGSGDAAANVLDKAAKIVEERTPEYAAKLWQHAADVSSMESGQHQSAEYVSKASRTFVKLGLYDEAVDSIRREIGYHAEHNNNQAIGRLTVAMVLVQLARGDTVAAEKAYKEWGNTCEAPESQTIEMLLAAYDEEDRESAKRALRSPFIRHMDVEYARLSTIIPLPEGMAPVPKVAMVENAAPSYVSDSQRTGVEATGSKAAGSEASGFSYTVVEAHKPPKSEDEDELC